MSSDYSEEFTDLRTRARLRERIDGLTREILAWRPRSDHEAVDIGKIVAENCYGGRDQSNVIAAMRTLGAFYVDEAARIERWAAAAAERRHDTE
jgi:hypothetical protein